MSETKPPLLLDIPHELTGQRLILRTPHAGDGKIVYPSARDSLAELKLWMPWATDNYDEQSGEEWCRKAAAEFLLRTQLPFLILSREDGTHMGNISAFKFEWEVRRCEVGYWLRTSHTGRGYMTEAAGILLSMLRGTLRMRRVEIRTDAKNIKSRRVAELAGFQLEGILRNESLTVGGRLRDTCIFSWVEKEGT